MASADHHDWRSVLYHDPDPVDLLWNNANNWSITGNGFGVPAAGDTIRFELASSDPGTTPASPIVMNVNYNDVGLGGVGALTSVRFTGNEDVSIQNYLKVTDTGNTGIQLSNGSLGGSYVRVDTGGTIWGKVVNWNNADRAAPTLDFAGGNWAAGDWYYHNEQRTIVKITSASGSITPNKILVSDAPWQSTNANRWPQIHFVLAAAGVAPIGLTAASNPLDFQNTAAGTKPFKLTVDASLYAGASVDIPLITHTTDTDRMFGAGNITIAGAPAGMGAFVAQTDTGSTLTLVGAGDWSGGASPTTSWADTGNWTGSNVPGLTLARTIANFPTGVTPVTVTLDGTSPTLAVLNINSGAAAASAYSIGQGSSGTINLGATPTGTANAAAQINVLQGTANAISAPVALTMDAQVNTAASTSLAMSGPISGAYSLTKGGDGTLVLSGGANSYSGATIIEGGILSVSTLANAGSPSDLGNYATSGPAGIVLKGGTLKYTGSTMGTAIDRGITLAASSTVNLPISGDLRLGSLALASAAAMNLNVTGSGGGTSRLYIDSVVVPTSTASRTGPTFVPSTASLTIGSITGNGNFQMLGESGTDNIITGQINLGNGNTTANQEQIYGPWKSGCVWTIMAENAFNGRWYAAQGTLKIKSPGALVGSQNVSTAFGNGDWPGTADNNTKFYNGNTDVQLLNDLSTSYENGSGQRTSVRAAAAVKFTVGPQTTATGQTHKMGNMWIHDNNTVVTVNAFGASGYGLTFDDVRFRDGGANYAMTILNNTTLALASAIKTAGANTLTAKFDGSGTTTVTGAVSQTTGTFKITQQGAGTLILQGVNTYIGDTVISAGTLTLADNAQLKFVIPATSPNGNKTISGSGTCNLNGDFYIDTALTDASGLTTGSWLIENVSTLGGAYGGTFRVVDSAGNPWTDAGSDKWTKTVLTKLYTFDETTGTLTLSVAVTDPYVTWAGAGVAFDADANNDGVDNGMAWVLGALNKDANATSLLPTLDNTSDPTYFIFTYNRKDDANTDPNTTIKAQYCSDLATWTDAVAGPDIIITPTDEGGGTGIDSVQVKIKRTLAVGGKLFARLNVQKAP